MDHKVSLIIPVKDEEGSISSLLESIERQTRKPDEVVITDAGSTDRTAAIIESYIMKVAYPVKLIKGEDAYPGKARNIAISHSAHDLVAMTDAGIRLDKNWLKELLNAFNRSGTDVVYGDYEPVVDSFFKECLASVFVPPRKVKAGSKMRTHFIASSLMRKRVWEEVGGFPDFRAAEDRIFMARIEKRGFKVTFAPAAKVRWDIPSNFRETFRRFSLYSMHDIKAGAFRDWHRPVIAIYLGGLALLIMGLFLSPLWLILLAAGILARAIGLLMERATEKRLSEKLDMRRIALVCAIMLWIDIAMFAGMASYILRRIRGR